MAAKYFNDLAAVTTVTECATMYNVQRRTVQRWCDEGRVIAVRSGGVWLISVRSLLDFRGFPPNVADASDTPHLADYT